MTASSETLRIALLADTHGELDERVAAAVTACDYAVHAGDIGTAALLRLLKPRRGLVVAVRGNNDTPDKWPAGERQMLESLPYQDVLALPGGDVAVIHGHQVGAPANRHAALRRRFPTARLVLYGHSHRRIIDCSMPPWVVNPGAAGRVRTYGGPSLAILEIDGVVWRVTEQRFEPR